MVCGVRVCVARLPCDLCGYMRSVALERQLPNHAIFCGQTVDQKALMSLSFAAAPVHVRSLCVAEKRACVGGINRTLIVHSQGPEVACPAFLKGKSRTLRRQWLLGDFPATVAKPCRAQSSPKRTTQALFFWHPRSRNQRAPVNPFQLLHSFKAERSNGSHPPLAVCKTASHKACDKLHFMHSGAHLVLYKFIAFALSPATSSGMAFAAFSMADSMAAFSSPLGRVITQSARS